MPLTTTHGIVIPASDLEPANGYGALVALGTSVEVYAASIGTGTWVTTFVPTATAATGTFTSVSCTSRYIQIGKLVHIHYVISITTNGTAAGNVRVGLPIASATGVNNTAFGRANGVSGKLLQGIIVGDTQVYIFNYDGTYPGSNGESLVVDLTYEVA